MAAPDTRPTVNFGTRRGASPAEARKAAADLKAGKLRAQATERTEAYQRALAKRPNRAAAATRRRLRQERNNPSPTRTGPTSDQFKYTVE